MNILIVEDEPFAQQEMQRVLLKVRPESIILAFLDSVEDSVNWLKANASPDLILMDIELSDGISFEIFNQVTVDCPIVFTTAYNEFAVRAFQVNSIDYLLKPIETESLNRAFEKLERVRSFFGSIESGPQIDSGELNEDEIGSRYDASFSQKILHAFKEVTPTYKSRFMISLPNDRIGFVEASQVAYLPMTIHAT
jgi:two-component system, LytTR family, response regulator